MLNWINSGPSVLAAFMASLVECVEALTIILAVGITRGWRSTLFGTFMALTVLIIIVLIFGPLLANFPIPIRGIQIVLGLLLIIFGFRWTKKAIKRAAGLIPLHDEAKIFNHEIQQLGAVEKVATFLDWLAFVTSFKAVLLEGMEVVFIVIALGTVKASYLPFECGAALALITVILLGLFLHRPLTRIPENTLKLSVGIILLSFGVFWMGEEIGYPWPGDDLAIPLLILVITTVSLGFIRHLKEEKN